MATRWAATPSMSVSRGLSTSTDRARALSPSLPRCQGDGYRAKLLSGERLRNESLGSPGPPPSPTSRARPPPARRPRCLGDGASRTDSTSSTSRRAAGSPRGEPRGGIARGTPCGPGTFGRASREATRRSFEDLASPFVPRRTSGSVSARGASPRSVGARVAPSAPPASRLPGIRTQDAGLTAGTFGSLAGRSPTR